MYVAFNMSILKWITLSIVGSLTIRARPLVCNVLTGDVIKEKRKWRITIDYEG